VIKLYHYSSKDFKGYIKPGFFGENNYSNNSNKISGIKRSYFYLDKTGREFYFNGVEFLYIAEIKESLLYNLSKDELKLAGRYNDIYKELKKRGYKGVIGNNGYICGVLFYPIKIKRQERLTR
jgi:hypothetical protein